LLKADWRDDGTIDVRDRTWIAKSRRNLNPILGIDQARRVTGLQRALCSAIRSGCTGSALQMIAQA
jgi:hypothetical protein